MTVASRYCIGTIYTLKWSVRTMLSCSRFLNKLKFPNQFVCKSYSENWLKNFFSVNKDVALQATVSNNDMKLKWMECNTIDCIFNIVACIQCNRERFGFVWIIITLCTRDAILMKIHNWYWSEYYVVATFYGWIS